MDLLKAMENFQYYNECTGNDSDAWQHWKLREVAEWKMNQRNLGEQYAGVVDGYLKFKTMAQDLKPLTEEMMNLLKAHGIEGMAYLELKTDGYVSFSYRGSDWKIIKASDEYPMEIALNYREEID